MSKLETNQVDPATGTTLTLGTSGDTITIPAGVNANLGSTGSTITVPSGSTIVNSGTATGFGLAECSFRAYQNSQQNVPNATSTQITLDTEDWDTDNAFASNTFTCPSDKAGKYIVVGAVRADPSWASTDQFNVMIYRNGASNTGSMSSFSLRAGIGNSAVTAQIIDLSAGDTLKLYMYHNEGGSEGLQTGQESTYMAGTRITT